MKSRNKIMALACILSLAIGCSGKSGSRSPTPNNSTGQPPRMTDQVAVDEALRSLPRKILGKNEALTDVATDLLFPTELEQGVQASWKSSLPTLVDSSGHVIRPAAPTCQGTHQSAQIEAELKKNSAHAVYTAVVSVPCLPWSDAEAVAAAKTALNDAAILGSNQELSQLRAPLILPATGANDTLITWSSDKPAVLDGKGRIYRDDTKANDAVLTAHISRGSTHETAHFPVTVMPLLESADEILREAEKSITLESILAPGETASTVMSDLTLASEGPFGTKITWNTDGKVQRPAVSQANHEHRLAYTISLNNGAQRKGFFDLNILALEASDAQILEADSLWLTDRIIAGANTSLTDVTQDLNLPTVGPHGSTLVWTVMPAAATDGAIAANGKVTLPKQKGQSFTLKALISKGGLPGREQTFAVFVPAVPATEEQIVAADREDFLAHEAVFLQDNASRARITSDLKLSRRGKFGSTITWTLPSDGSVRASGFVARPPAQAVAHNARLVATFTQGKATQSLTIDLTIQPKEATATDRILADFAAIRAATILNTNSDTAQIAADLKLKTRGIHGSSIEWKVIPEGSDVLSRTGYVVQPDVFTPSVPVKLEYTVTQADGQAQVGTFDLTVVAKLPSPKQVVAKDIEELPAILEQLNGNLARVSQDLTLPSKGAHGSDLEWSTSDTAVVDKSGKVKRPLWKKDGPNVLVQISVKARAGKESAERSFDVSVLRNLPSDSEVTAWDRDWLDQKWLETSAVADSILGQNGSMGHIRSDLNLPKQGEMKSDITWTSNNPSVISAAGRVMAPAWDQAPIPVQLTAHIRFVSSTVERVYDLTVEPVPGTADQLIEADYNSITAATILKRNSKLTEIVGDLNLPSRGTFGSTITWSWPAWVNTLQASGAVKQPEAFESPIEFDLNYTVSMKGGQSKSNKFLLHIVPKAPTDQEAIDRDWRLFAETSILPVDSSLDSVSKTLILKREGNNGTQIRWESSNPQIVENNGTVNLPAWKFGEDTVPVTLTATFSRGGGQPKRKSIDIKVLRKAASALEKAQHDLAALSLKTLLNGNSSELKIRSKLNPVLTGELGSVITWSSNNAAIQPSGFVTQPVWNAQEIPVTFTATVLVGVKEVKREFPLTVVPKESTPGDNLAADIESFKWESVLGTNASSSDIRYDLVLPNKGLYGSRFTWTFTPNSVIDASGHVNRPAWDAGSAAVKATLTMSRDDESALNAVKTLDLMVTPFGASNEEKIQVIEAEFKKIPAIVLGRNPSFEALTSALTLPSSFVLGSTISWTVEPAESLDLSTGALVQPVPGAEASKGTLTATVKVGGQQKVWQFPFTVLPESYTDLCGRNLNVVLGQKPCLMVPRYNTVAEANVEALEADLKFEIYNLEDDIHVYQGMAYMLVDPLQSSSQGLAQIDLSGDKPKVVNYWKIWNSTAWDDNFHIDQVRMQTLVAYSDKSHWGQGQLAVYRIDAANEVEQLYTWSPENSSDRITSTSIEKDGIWVSTRSGHCEINYLPNGKTGNRLENMSGEFPVIPNGLVGSGVLSAFSECELVSAGNRLYVWAGRYQKTVLLEYDVSVPSKPKLLNEHILAFNGPMSFGSNRMVYENGKLALLERYKNKAHIVDLGPPFKVHDLDTSSPLNITIADGLVYVPDFNSRSVGVFSSEGSFRQVATYDLYANGVAFDGDNMVTIDLNNVRVLPSVKDKAKFKTFAHEADEKGAGCHNFQDGYLVCMDGRTVTVHQRSADGSWETKGPIDLGYKGSSLWGSAWVQGPYLLLRQPNSTEIEADFKRAITLIDLDQMKVLRTFNFKSGEIIAVDEFSYLLQTESIVQEFSLATGLETRRVYMESDKANAALLQGNIYVLRPNALFVYGAGSAVVTDAYSIPDATPHSTNIFAALADGRVLVPFKDRQQKVIQLGTQGQWDVVGEPFSLKQIYAYRLPFLEQAEDGFAIRDQDSRFTGMFDLSGKIWETLFVPAENDDDSFHVLPGGKILRRKSKTDPAIYVSQ